MASASSTQPSAEKRTTTFPSYNVLTKLINDSTSLCRNYHKLHFNCAEQLAGKTLTSPEVVEIVRGAMLMYAFANKMTIDQFDICQKTTNNIICELVSDPIFAQKTVFLFWESMKSL